MPPKKQAQAGGSKKAEQKKKEKIIEDKTFGLKNKKGAKQQKFIKAVTHQVKFGQQNPRQVAQSEAEKKLKKDDKKKELQELNELFKPVVAAQKISKGADPKSVVCAFFKQGQCTKGDKCKFSHDLTLERKGEKRSVYIDARDEELEKDTMDNWDEKKLEEVVNKKHGEAEKKKPKTQIVCKHFLDAIENNKYGWFWVCPGGGDICMYRHALPPGFVLKKDKKKEEKEDEISLEDLIERERAALGPNVTKITLESFLAWKKRKRQEKIDKLEQDMERRKADFKAGKALVISGREVFEFRPELVDDDDEEADDTRYTQGAGGDEVDDLVSINDIDVSLYIPRDVDETGITVASRERFSAYAAERDENKLSEASGGRAENGERSDLEEDHGGEGPEDGVGAAVPVAKMLMELSAGAANFTDQKEFSLQDIEVLGRCFLTVVQVHFQFLTQALQKVQPVAHSCFAEVVVPEKKSSTSLAGMGHTPELEEAVRSWRGAAEATSRLRERGCDGRLAGIEVQQLFCSQSAAIPEHQLKELNIKIDSALQAYKIALESLGHCEYAMKAGFHLNPKAIEASLQGCCSEAEAQQTGRRQTPPQPMQCELPTVPVQIGSHFLKGVSFNESAADNLKLKTHTMLQLIKEAGCYNGITPRDDFPVTEVLNQVCPSTWRGACKTAVQLLFGQAGLVVVDTAQIENKEAYAPQISLEGSRIVVQVPSTWCLKEDPATMSLLQRSLDPEKTLGLVDVLYTAVLDLSRWRAGREQALPCIQIQLQREMCDFGNQADLPSGNGNKSSGGLQKTFSKLTSRFTKKASCTSSGSSTNYSILNTPSKSIFIAGCSEEKAKMPSNIDSRLQSILNIGNFPRTADPSQSAQNPSNQMANGFLMERRDSFLQGDDGKDEKGMNLPTDQEMQEVIDFLSGFNMGQSHQSSPLVTRRNSAATALVTEQKAGAMQPQQPPLPAPPPPRPPQAGTHTPLTPQQGLAPQQQSPKQQQPQVQYYQHLLQPIGPQQPPPQPRAPGKWVHGSSQQPAQPVGVGLSPLGQWPGMSDLSSDLYSLGLVSSYMDNMMSEVLGQKPQGPRNNTWPNRDQSDGVFGMLGEILPFDPAVGSDPEFARYVAGVSQAMQQKRQVQHSRRPGNPRGHWPPMDDAHRTWPFPEFFTEGDGLHSGWSGTQGDSASSSDETSSANGDSLFSMFSGPDLVAAVKQRRKHSSGEQETSTLPSPPLLTTVEDVNQDNKTKTWPPKAPWQHPSPLPSTLPSPGAPLYAVTSPGSQWNDTMQMLQSPVWAASSDCSTASFSYVQTPPQPPPPAAHKAAPKGFKAFPGKAERRPAYLPQY